MDHDDVASALEEGRAPPRHSGAHRRRSPSPPRARSTIKSPLRAAAIAILVHFIGVIKAVALYIARRPSATVAQLAALFQACSRRDYSLPRRPKTKDWWEKVVPDMRLNHRRRYIRNFRVPPCVMDEIVGCALQHPYFMTSDSNAARAIDVSKKVHMALWRLGRPATVADCGELFGVSDGFVEKWTPIVLYFIYIKFGDRIWKRECCPTP